MSKANAGEAEHPSPADAQPAFREVENTTAVAQKEGETFLTQRAGKLSVPVIQNESISMFESRKTLQSTLLLQKKKEMQQVQSLLENKRSEFAKRMDECKEKQEELRTKVEQELSLLHEQLTKEQLKAENILRMIVKYKVYERYLQSVVDVLPADYLDVNEPHINDVIMRHKTLVETNDDLINILQQYQDDTEKEAGRLTELVKEKNDLILVYNSTLGTQKKKYDKLKQECAYLEQKIEERDNTGKERMRILGETKMAINNLHDRLGLHTRMHLSAIIASANAPLPAPVSNNMMTFPGIQTTQEHLGASAVVGNTTIRENPILKQDPDNVKTLTDKLHAIMERVLDLQR
ncbi:hypothetical protein HK096_008338 [Nowakowskiella sp. JEL0078]|nr:hypothetical protein HK096_008338 [Nowakowskiella sp. JEL0078]